ncbi:hypothetical protein JTE90_000095, partial [Oedothorax gibbosus]
RNSIEYYSCHAQVKGYRVNKFSEVEIE